MLASALSDNLWSSPWYLPAVVALGLVAGLLGGMLGVGGSVIMIPGLTMVLGRDQHLYQAAAMIANVAVSIPATLRHRRQQAMVPEALKWMLPPAVLLVFAGVALSNMAVFRGDGQVWLGRLLALFLVYVMAMNAQRLLHPRSARLDEAPPPRVSRASCGLIGAAMGMIAGLLGIGGGALAVPAQQVMLKMPLRHAIANSSAIICISAALGAIHKNATLGYHDVRLLDSLLLAAMLTPTAWVGGHLGASLTHRLPLRQVRMAFIALMAVAAWRMAKLPWP